MSNLLEFKGFKAKIEFSAEDNVFFGHLIGIDDVVSFEGETVAQLKTSFEEAVDFHIEVCEKSGKQAKKNFSGKLLLRIPQNLHEAIAESAAKRGKSINKWGEEVFREAVKV
jgi:predicted HicB family RNase H-like nuclease